MHNRYYLDATSWWQSTGNNHLKDKNTSIIRLEENEFDVDEGNQRWCEACYLPIFSTPYKSSCCNSDTENLESGPHLPLHQCCANLAPIFTKALEHSGGPLHLHKLFGGDRSDLVCFYCKEECRGYFYQCSTSNCRFTVDIKCATTINIVHRSHHHELTFMIPEKENLLYTCRGCGLEHKGQFYRCRFHGCGFYLHRDCALLHNTILHNKHTVVAADIDGGQGQQHPLTLTFNIPRDSFKFIKSDICYICNHKLSSIEAGIYFCTKCDYAAHVKCAISDPDDISPVSSREIAGGLPHFPMENEDTSLIQYLQKKGYIISDVKRSEAIEEQKLHIHELILQKLNKNEKHICSACIDPIISNNSHPTFYTCRTSQCATNPFYLHQSCANLPLNLKHPLHHYILGGQDCKDDPLVLLPTSSSNNLPFSMFLCYYGCEKYCNGFLYSCEKCGFELDVKCAVLPDTITYELHGKSHILFLCYRKDGPTCNCCYKSLYKALYYICSSCPNFTIEARCVLLPSRVSHKYDRHPLKLTPYDETSTPKHGDEDFCEICEESMPTRKWLYHCKECTTSFHIECIPCAGWLSRTKFGGTIHVRCHHCPLTCIRLLDSYNYTCGLCEKTIHGRRETTSGYDSIAFECTKCGFWLHYECAYMEWIRD